MTVIDLELNPIRRARFWLDELPADAAIVPEDVIVGNAVAGAPVGGNVLEKCGIEILYPSPPMWHYGFIGATFAPDDSGAFRSRISVAADVPRHLTWSLTADDPQGQRVGLTSRVAHAIAGVLALDDPDFNAAPPSGELAITHAASTPHGGAPVIFEALADSLLGLLSEEPSRLDETRLLQIVRAGLKRGYGRR